MLRKILALITIIAIVSGLMPAAAGLYPPDSGAAAFLPMAALESPAQSVARVVDVENPLAARYAGLPGGSNAPEVAALPASPGPKVFLPRSGGSDAGGFSAGLAMRGCDARGGQPVCCGSPGGGGILSAILIAFLVILSRINLPLMVRFAARFSARLAFESRVFLLPEAVHV